MTRRSKRGIDPSRHGKSGDFAHFLSGARFFRHLQVFGSPKPVAGQQKTAATLHFLNCRVALPLFRPGIGLGVPVACVFSSPAMYTCVDSGALVPMQSGCFQCRPVTGDVPRAAIHLPSLLQIRRRCSNIIRVMSGWSAVMLMMRRGHVSAAANQVSAIPDAFAHDTRMRFGCARGKRCNRKQGAQ